MSNIYNRIIYFGKLIGFEATIWILGLFYLAFLNSPGKNHFTICPLSNLGIEFCPGCGLGSSISFFINGDISDSFNAHPLGIIALIIIVFRIFSLIINNRRRTCLMSYN